MSESQKMRVLEQGEYQFVNAVMFEYTSTGILPRRVDAELLEASKSFLPDHSDMATKVMRMSAGIELQLKGRGITHVSVELRIVQDDGYPQRAALFQGDFKIHPLRELFGNFSPQTLAWTLPKKAFIPDLPLRVLLPTHAEIEVLGAAVNQDALISSRSPFREGHVRWLAHGDSITQGANVSSPDLTWIEQVSRKLKLDPINLGFGGIALAQEAIAEHIARRQDWDLLSIHIGANSFGRCQEDYRRRYAKFLSIIQQAHPEKTVVCCTPILHHSDWSSASSLLSVAESVREAIRDACQEVEAPTLHLVEGREIMNEPTGLVGDGVHLSDHGATIYAENLSKRLAQIISHPEKKDLSRSLETVLSAHRDSTF